MEIILVMLCGILMGAFNFGFFCLGYYCHSRKEPQEGVKLTKENAEFIKGMMDWRNYGGK
jgi:hypothetical protein